MLNLKKVFVNEDDIDEKKITSPMPEEREYYDSVKKQSKTYSSDITFENMLGYSPLNASQEVHVFRRMNFYKYKIIQSGDDKKIPHYKNLAIRDRDLLICSNFRMVFYTLKSKCGSVNEDVFSHMIPILMRCVEYFDYRRGFKFSTYLTWAIIKEMSNYKESSNKNRLYENLTENSLDSFPEKEESEVSEYEIKIPSAIS